ncbi:MAG: Two-component sensor histidine kinase [Labilithrix sp.]|nr:Two-component sensor histidine kinase [Labilithrix sp.]
MSSMHNQAMTTLGLSRAPSIRAARAHELKNHLSLILAVSKLVEHDVAERSRERLSRVHDAVRRMAELIDEDLVEEHSLPRPQGDAGAMVSVDAIVRDVAGRVSDLAACAGVELVVSCGGGVLRGHAGELTEALVNLVSNAIEASHTGAAVVLTTAETQDGDQEWTVRDTGCGMTREILAQIGRPFCSHRAGGSGLGLAVAHDAVSRDGGLLHIDSAPGAGTTVTIWLPRAGSCE